MSGCCLKQTQIISSKKGNRQLHVKCTLSVIFLQIIRESLTGIESAK